MALFGTPITGIVNVPAGGSASVQPAVGEEWLVLNVSSPGSVNMGLTDGTLVSYTRLLNTRIGQERPMRMYVTRDDYLHFQNPGGAAIKVAYSALVTTRTGDIAGVGDAKVDIISVVSGGVVAIQPPAGQAWMIHELGSTAWATGTGNPSLQTPSVNPVIYDGVDSVSVISLVEMWVSQSRFIIDNTRYLRMTNGGGATHSLCYSGVRVS
jgi:hypothetical protein